LSPAEVAPTAGGGSVGTEPDPLRLPTGAKKETLLLGAALEQFGNPGPDADPQMGSDWRSPRPARNWERLPTSGYRVAHKPNQPFETPKGAACAP
jgi:hypothetical protein